MWQRIEDECAQWPREDGFPDEIMMKTHFRMSLNHPLLGRTKAAVYLIRDPRDVAMSALEYFRFQRPHEEFGEAEFVADFAAEGGSRLWRRRGFGTWAESATSWINQDAIPVHVVRFERLKRDTVGELCQILEFLGARFDPQRAQAAVDSTSASRLRQLEMSARLENRFGKVDESRHFIRAADRSRRRFKEHSAEIVEQFRHRFEVDMRRFGYEWMPPGNAA
jgi:hypothetical protein